MKYINIDVYNELFPYNVYLQLYTTTIIKSIVLIKLF